MEDHLFPAPYVDTVNSTFLLMFVSILSLRYPLPQSMIYAHDHKTLCYFVLCWGGDVGGVGVCVCVCVCGGGGGGGGGGGY